MALGGCACRALVLKPQKSRPDTVTQSAEMFDDELGADAHRHGLAFDNVSRCVIAKNTLISRGSHRKARSGASCNYSRVDCLVCPPIALLSNSISNKAMTQRVDIDEYDGMIIV